MVKENLEMLGVRMDISQLGGKVHWCRTGSPDWIRGFITHPDGYQIGRIVIHHGEFSHIKWYGHGHTINQGFSVRLAWLRDYGVLVTPADWNMIVMPDAYRRQQADLELRQEARRQLEAEDMRVRKVIKKRRAITGKVVGSFVRPPWEIQQWQDQPSKQ
ncbi:coil containing protein [Vibrio phage 2.117.O._10N.261.45.E9]|nr:coil containing protein [Vibrio phage 1.117.O._10N.261.45.E9]AUR95410.1 coil containing protein [Vibrio phage 1.207.B._10N.222.51.C2]AUS02301.1 coil containing protein [Vibrio phage 2.117.O._10N.261.45.E9]